MVIGRRTSLVHACGRRADNWADNGLDVADRQDARTAGCRAQLVSALTKHPTSNTSKPYDQSHAEYYGIQVQNKSAYKCIQVHTPV